MFLVIMGQSHVLNYCGTVICSYFIVGQSYVLGHLGSVMSS